MSHSITLGSLVRSGSKYRKYTPKEQWVFGGIRQGPSGSCQSSLCNMEKFVHQTGLLRRVA